MKGEKYNNIQTVLYTIDHELLFFAHDSHNIPSSIKSSLMNNPELTLAYSFHCHPSLHLGLNMDDGKEQTIEQAMTKHLKYLSN